MNPFGTPGVDSPGDLTTLSALAELTPDQSELLQDRTGPTFSTPTQHPTTANTSFPTVPAQEEPDRDILDYGLDFLKGIESGGIAAVQETGQFLYDAVTAAPRWAANKLSDSGTAGDEMLPDVMPGYEALESAKFKPETALGKVMEGITNFAVGFIGAGKFLKGAKFMKNLGTVGRGMAQGAVADAVAINPLEGRLSNLCTEIPFLKNPVTEALSASPDDSRWEGRFKNAVEGVLVGGALDMTLGMLRGLRGYVFAKTPEEGRKALVAASEETEKALGARTEAAPFMQHPEDFPAPHKNNPEIMALYAEAKANAKTPEELMRNVRENINPARFSMSDEMGYQVHDTLARRTFDETILGKEGSKTLEEIVGHSRRTIDEARVFSDDVVAEQLARAEANSEAAIQMARDDFVLGEILAATNREWRELGAKIQDGFHNGPLDEARFALLEENLMRLTVAAKDRGTTSARVLAAMRLTYKDTGQIVAGNTDDLVKRLKDMDFKNTAGNSAQMLKYIESARTKGWKDAAIEMYMNNILSGPFTHVVNIVSNSVKAVLTPIYNAGGSLAQGDLRGAADALWHNSHLASTIMPALRLAWQAVKEDRAILEGLSGRSGWMDGMGKVGQINRAVSKENYLARYYKEQVAKGMSPAEAMNVPSHIEARATVIGWLGKAINLPTRILQAEDEFFKQLAYRSELRADLTAQAWEQFGRKDKAAIAEFVAREEQKFFTEAGQGTDKALLDFSRRQTFNQRLTGPARKLQEFSNSSPFIKVVLPFIRTPTNLLLEARDMTPLALFGQRYREAIKQGGRAAAEAEGKLAFGTLSLVGAFLLAHDGTITGSGPTDPKAREAEMRKGWRPNSIRIGDTYFTFNRFDPFSTLLTGAANLIQGAQHMTDEQREDMGKSLLALNLRMLGDKSYLQSMGDLLDAWQGDETALGRLGRSMAAGAVPYSGLLRTIRTSADEEQRDTHSLWSGIQNTLPGGSSGLPAKRDWLTGEPLEQSYGFLSQVKDDPVADELARLKGVFKTPPYSLNGVGLTEAQHSRYCELIGTTRINGKTLHQTLSGLVASAQYDAERQRNLDEDGGRAQAVNRIITAYRQLASAELFKEDVELKTTVADKKLAVKAKNIPNGSQLRPTPSAPALTRSQQRGLEDLTSLISTE